MLALSQVAAVADPLSINDALHEAVRTNPAVGEASANRRATESSLRQTQSTLLPQVRVEASWGPEKFDQNYSGIQPIPGLTGPVTGSGPWRNGSTESVVVRQLLFDGFASIHDIWRQTARVNAAAYRVREHTELVALDAAEAYIDVVRYMRLVDVARQNLANHETIFSNVSSRFSGGRAGQGDLEQARERVEGARANLADLQKSLEDARAAYRKTVGLEPINLRFPSPLRGMPSTRDEALAQAVRYNPTIQAAQADVDAAKHAYRVTDGSFVPKVYLEGRATHYDNSYPYVTATPGMANVTHEDYSGKVVMSWDIFRGGQDTWARNEAGERYTEAAMHHASLQRGALESIDKAWAARTVTATRIAALQRQLEAGRKTIAAFQKEYELGQRSLIDLLNAQNQYFNAQVSLTSARGVAVFADYQLLAAMGGLLEYLKAPPPVDAAPMDLVAFRLPAYKLAPVRWGAPQVGSQPLLTAADYMAGSYSASIPMAYGSVDADKGQSFNARFEASSKAQGSLPDWFTSTSAETLKGGKR
ncbi:MAG: TolC family outer membrane protein [Alphaproteobacteria bacterium]|nr:TolC family outer membrane protein [Alphaproteobacteria bacterium]